MTLPQSQSCTSVFAGADALRKNADCSPTVCPIEKAQPDMNRQHQNHQLATKNTVMAQL